VARDLVLDVITHDDSAGLRGAARDLDTTATRADHMGQRFHEAGRESGILNKALFDARAELRRMEEQLAKTGDTTLLKGITSQRSLVNRLDKVAKDLAPAARAAGQDIGDAASNGIGDALMNMGDKPLIIGAIVGAGLLAAPAIGAAIGGAVTGAVGLGGIVGGVIAAAQNPLVKSAWSEFASDASQEFSKMGLAFVGPVIESIGILDAHLKDLHLSEAFRPAAGYVTTIAEGIGGMVDSLTGGFAQALILAGPVITELATELPPLGDAIGQMLTDMASGSGNVEGLRTAFALLDGTLIATGKTVEILSDSFHVLIPIGTKLGEVLTGITKGTGLDLIFGTITQGWKSLSGSADGLDKAIVGVNGHLLDAGTNAQRGAGMMDGFHTAISGAATAMRDELDREIDAFLNKALGAKDATLAWAQVMLDLVTATKQHGGSLNTATQAGIDNNRILERGVQLAIDKRDAVYKETHSVEAANAVYETMIGKLRAEAIAHGMNKAAVDKFLASLHLVPANVTTTIHVNIKGGAGFNAFLSAVNQLASGLGSSSSGSAPHGFAPARASGGPVWPGQAYTVGESGRELFVPSVPGQIQGAGRTAAGASASGGPLRIAITLDGTGLAQNLKAAVRGEGGVDVYFEQRR
jgi:hypothetical protein